MSEHATTDLAGEMMPSSSTFSYAQAAKGRQISQNGTAEPLGPPANSTSNKVDTESSPMQKQVSIDTDHKTPSDLFEHSNGTAVGSGDQMEEAASKKRAAEEVTSVGTGISHDQKSTSSHEQSHDTLSSSGSTGQVGRPLKDDDVFATQNESDSTWDRVSQESQAGLASDKFEADTDDSRLSTWEHVQGPQFKEAPVPSVNIWQKRALDAQAKAKETKSPSPSVSRDQKLERSTESLKENSKRKTENRSAFGKDSSAKPQVSGGQSTQKGARTPEGQKGLGIVVPPPPPNDAMSWPTPNLAKEDERRKPQERGERGDKEKTPSRPHGKEKWEKVDYVPTAVFNTPLPTPRRGGGRIGGRGGREGGPRGGHVPHGGDGAADRSVSGPNPAMSGTNATPPNERSKGDMGPPKAGPLESKQRRSVSAGPPSSRDQPRGVAGSHDKRDDNGARQFGTRPFRENRRVSVSTQTDVAQRPGPQYIPENNRRSSIINDQHQGMGGPGDHTASRFPMDRRGEGSIRPQEYGRETNGYHLSRERREGRPERGRGGFRAKASQNHANFGGNGNQPPIGHAFGSNKYQHHPEQRHNSQPHAPPFGNNRELRHGRANSRSQSISNAQGYGRFGNGPSSAGPHQLPPLQIGVANMYPYQPEHPGAMSAVPYHPYMEHVQLQGMVQMQMEYYFSLDNLCKDMYLRKNMDSQGFVFLHVLQKFNRIKQLTEDLDLLRFVCVKSPLIEIRAGPDGLDRVRKVGDWQQWTLNPEDRDPSARTDGPTQLSSPLFAPQPAVSVYGPFDYQRGSVSSNPMSPREFYPGNGNNAEPGPMNGTVPPRQVSESQSIQTPLSAAVPDFKPTYSVLNSASYESLESPVQQEGTFSDDKIDSLSIIVRRPKISANQSESPFEIPSETLSNGNSIHETSSKISSEHNSSDSDNVVARRNSSLVETQFDEPRSTQATTSHDGSESRDISWGFNVRLPNRDYITSPVHWQREKNTRAENGYENITHESYLVFKGKALQGREQVSDGQCHRDMAILYEFWSHFLIRHLNITMYKEFRTFALTDLRERNSDTGLKHLITFYYEWLLGPNIISDLLAKDFVDIVRTEDGKQEKPALNALRAAWRNGAFNFKSRVKIDGIISKQVKAELER